ncbi:hypothetical protein BSL78_11708 [Apostichopus japonicus]|uniref:Peptidase C1A papain C-terminal domain-containing protein n=1 Tax=Stichopus japonicus TaxID=307972 RepID=A0A2G8KTQ9_STIJA|nr:hypothetical protein BSL78_11708 [Apostichopus japonicus]
MLKRINGSTCGAEIGLIEPILDPSVLPGAANENDLLLSKELTIQWCYADVIKMRFFIVLTALVGIGLASPPNLKDVSATPQKMVDYINSLNSTWKAGQNFKGRTLDQVKKLMGTRLDSKGKPQLEKLYHTVKMDLPDNFDARTQWPDCPTIKEIRDQGSCGSCWAFGAVEAMSDRYCIHSKGAMNYHISAQDLATCCKSCGDGSASQTTPKLTATTRSLVSRRDRGCEENLSTFTSISVVRGMGTGVSVGYRGSKAYSIASDPVAIQQEIFSNGPVEADFQVYADFFPIGFSYALMYCVQMVAMTTASLVMKAKYLKYVVPPNMAECEVTRLRPL